MSFFAELKRRNVFKVGAAYVVLAWLLAQGVDVFLANFGAPEWVVKTILFLLVLGFPLALFFAWVYELTPEGIKKEKDVDRSQSITHKTGRKLDFLIIGILALALGYFIWEARFESKDAIPANAGVQTENNEGGSAEVLDATNRKSIAVLPFVNMSEDANNEYFSDGISEEILNALAKVKELKVAGRTSSFAFKGKDQDLRQIGEALGVANILEGSVRKSGDKVRITAQLIQVDDGFHLWSESYDRELTDIFEIQDEIATAILEQLKTALIGVESESAVVAATRTDSGVYDLYLLARQRIYERKRLSIESAVEQLDSAIAMDPGYAPAYAQRGIAALLLSEYNYGDTKKAEAETQAMLYLDKALQLDPGLAEGWAGMGLYHNNRVGELQEGIDALEKALAINPNLIDASNWLQIAYGATGDNLRALHILEGMVERDPLYPPGFVNAVQMYNTFGQQEKSWALLERIRPYLPGDTQLLLAEANTWMTLGKPSKAIPLLQKALETQPNDATMRQYFGWGLMSTAQFELVAETGFPWQKAIALSILNRQEEAMMIAREQLSEGNVSPLFTQLSRAGKDQELVGLFESRWPDLAAFEAQYPDGGTGYADMLTLARAYSVVGNEQRFEDAMARVRKAHDRSNEQGIRVSYYLKDEARYYALAGDRERAIDLMSQAVDAGWMSAIRPDQAWPEMQILAGEPAYEKVVARMFDNVNAERTALGMDPFST